MKTAFVRSACLVSSIAFTFACVGCGSSDSGGTTTTTDSGHPATDSGVGGDSSTDTGGFNLDSSTSDTGSAKDSGAKTDSTTSDSSTTDSSPTDSSATDSTITDTATTDAPITETSDAPVDATGTTSGTKLVGGTFDLRGITTDDQILFLDLAGTAGLQAIAVTGTTPATVDASFAAASSGVAVSSRDAFVFDSIDSTTGVASLTLWSVAGGAHAVSTKALAQTRLIAANADGGYVMFADNAATDGSTADLVVEKNDGTGKVTVFAGIDAKTTAAGGACDVSVLPAGSSFLVVHCTPGGTASVDVVSTTGALTNIATDGLRATTDTAGDKVFFLTSTGDAKLVAATGGTPTAVDSGVGALLMSSDGSTIAWLTGTASPFTVKKSATSSISAVTVTTALDLGTPTAGQFLAIAPSLSAMLYSTVAVDATTATSDVNLLQIAASSTPVVLDGSATTAAVFGSGFTTDESRALFYSSVDTDDVGTFKSSAVTGGTATTLATRVWTDVSALGTKVVFNDAFDATARVADLRVVDAASSSPSATAIALRADLTFLLDNAKDKVVYTTTSVSAPGLYVAPVP